LRKFDFSFETGLAFLRDAREEKDGGREWFESFTPEEAAELSQRYRIDLTRLLEKPDLPAKERHEFQEHVQFLESRLVLLVDDLGKEGKALRPPAPVLGFGREEWERSQTLVRLIRLEEKYPEFAQQWTEDKFPLHEKGEPLRIRHIEANEYHCLQRAVEFMLGAEEELGQCRRAVFEKGDKSDQTLHAADQQNQPVSGGEMGTLSNTAPTEESKGFTEETKQIVKDALRGKFPKK